jgi:hypothetical protein
MLYKNLVDIGLKNYLDVYFSNEEWFLEAYLEKLDVFIANKGIRQKNILRRKFQYVTDHLVVNDHIYELLVALVFHPNGLFQDNPPETSSPDIIDGEICIEVKNINAEPKEIERIKTIVPNTVSYGPFPNDSDFEKRFNEKFSHRVNKAKKQIGNSGIIYIIWDTAIMGSAKRKSKIDKLLKKLSLEEMKQNPSIQIKTLDFENLRKLVSESKVR